MKPNKPERNVAGMDVLKDIRGLLSTTQESKISTEDDATEQADAKTKIARYKEEIEGYKELIQKQQEELEKLTKENEELVNNLNPLLSNKEEGLRPANHKAEELTQEVAQLELRKSELSQTLHEVMDLLQLKHKELLRRIALVYQEAGEGSIAIEFRRGADSLENAENLAHFLQILLGK